MAESKSLLVYAGVRDAQQKYDYFIAGVTGALFAYIAQTYTPRRIELNPSVFEPLALVFLALSFYLALRRIENTTLIGMLNHQQLDANEKAGESAKALRAGNNVVTDGGTDRKSTRLNSSHANI